MNQDKDPGPQGDPYEEAWNEGEEKPKVSPALEAMTVKAQAEKERDDEEFAKEFNKPDTPEVKAEPEPEKPKDFKTAFAQAMAKKKAEGGPDTFMWNGVKIALKYKDKAAKPADKPLEKAAGLAMPAPAPAAAPAAPAPRKYTAPNLVERAKDLEDKQAAKGEGIYGTKKSVPAAPEVNPVMGKSSVAEAIPKHAFMGKGS